MCIWLLLLSFYRVFSPFTVRSYCCRHSLLCYWHIWAGATLQCISNATHILTVFIDVARCRFEIRVYKQADSFRSSFFSPPSASVIQYNISIIQGCELHGMTLWKLLQMQMNAKNINSNCNLSISLNLSALHCIL